MALTPGTRLGVYAITAQIGEGGMGQVFRARDTKLDRDVAIKILPEAFGHDADRLARFTREAKTLASLNHPQIAAIYGLEESSGVTALVMELVEGEDLSQRIARGAMPIDEALPIAKQIAEALEAAHEQGIIHRDLKPENIKVRADGTVKVLDFGLAKAMEPASALHASAGQALSMSPTITSPAMMTGVGMILGTAAYMSPEQAKGRAVDKRSDVWAFGAVLFEMLTGQRAFSGEDVADVLSRVLQREPDFDALPPVVPARVSQVLRVCLRKDVKQRAHDMADVRLARAGRGGPPLAGDATRRPGRAVHDHGRHRRPRCRAGGGAGPADRHADGPRARRQSRPLRAGRSDERRRAGRRAWLAEAWRRQLSGLRGGWHAAGGAVRPGDPDDARHAGAGCPGCRDDRDRGRGRRGGGRRHTGVRLGRFGWCLARARVGGPIGPRDADPDAAARYVYPRLSPDGTRIAVYVADEENDIWAWDLARTTLARVTFGPGGGLYPVWTSDGRRLLFSSERAGARNLFQQAADGTGAVERLTESPNTQNATAITPDGRRLIFTEQTPKSSDDVMQVEVDGTHHVTPLVQSPFSERNASVSPDGRWLAYEASDSGRYEISVRPFPDGNRGHWQVSTIGGTRPLWAPNGQELFYASPTGAIMRVGVESGPSWAATPPTVLVKDGYFTSSGGNPGRTYDLSPDGQRFLMIKEGGGTDQTASPPQVIVVQHFDEELKRLVPTK